MACVGSILVECLTPGAVLGTTGDDVLVGTSGDDVLCAGSGNDVINGLGGNDHVYGGTGDDRINVGDGDDTAYGGPGNDSIYGGDGEDHLYADLGNDVVFGESGPDSITGDEGDDSLSGGDGSDHLFGGEGADVLNGGADQDRVNGGDQNDTEISQVGEDQCKNIEIRSAGCAVESAVGVHNITNIGAKNVKVAAIVRGIVNVPVPITVEVTEPVGLETRYSVSPIARIDIVDPGIVLQSATIDLPLTEVYDPARIGVFYREENGHWVRIRDGLSVGASGRSVTVTTNHFTDFTAMRLATRDATVSKDGFLKRNGCLNAAFGSQYGTAILLDTSGSSAEFQGAGLDEVTAELLDSGPGVVHAFGLQREEVFSLDTDWEKEFSKTADLGAFGDTSWAEPLFRASAALDNDLFRLRTLVIVGDGDSKESVDGLNEAVADFKKKQIAVEYVAYGPVSAALKKLVAQTGGRIHPVGTRTASEIATEVLDTILDFGVDKDAGPNGLTGDGISDCQESLGYPVYRIPGEAIETKNTSPSNWDSDGDHLADGDETRIDGDTPWIVDESMKRGQWIRFMISDPTKKHSDATKKDPKGDLMSDFDELIIGESDSFTPQSVLHPFRFMTKEEYANTIGANNGRDAFKDFIDKLEGWNKKFDAADDYELFGKAVWIATQDLDNFGENAENASGLVGKLIKKLGFDFDAHTNFTELVWKDKDYAARRASIVGPGLNQLIEIVELARVVHNDLIWLRIGTIFADTYLMIAGTNLLNTGFGKVLSGVSKIGPLANAAATVSSVVSSRGYLLAARGISIASLACALADFTDDKCPKDLKTSIDRLDLFFSVTGQTRDVVADRRAADAGFGGLSEAENFGIDSYKNLRPRAKADNAAKGVKNNVWKRLQVHHLIEKRFEYLFAGTNTDDFISAVLTKSEHDIITSAWRKKIGLKGDINNPRRTNTVTAAEVMKAAEEIYAKDFPALWAAIKKAGGPV